VKSRPVLVPRGIVSRDFDYRESRGPFRIPRPTLRDASRSVRPFVDARARETIKLLQVSILDHGVNVDRQRDRQRA